jgi:hypothetical protein
MAMVPNSDVAINPHKALQSQVGGHAGVVTTEDGSLLIKPSLHRELEFYQAMQQDPMLAFLREFTPTFIGVLRLEGKLSDLDGKLVEGGLSSLSEDMLEPVTGQKDMSSFRGETCAMMLILYIYSPLCWRTFCIRS